MSFGSIIHAISLPPPPPSGISFDGNYFRTVDGETDVLQLRNPTDFRVINSVSFQGTIDGARIACLINGGNQAWISSPFPSTVVYLVNFLDGSIISQFTTTLVAESIAYNGRHLLLGGGSTVHLVNPVTGVLIQALPLSTTILGMAILGNTLWLINDTTLVEVDFQTLKIIRTASSPASGARGLTFDGKHLWNINPTTGIVYQLSLN